jgi:ribosomal protein S18 acetylase RimI-like enzyme
MSDVTVPLQPTLRAFTPADLERTLRHLEATATATYSENFARESNREVRQSSDPATQLGGPGAKMIIADLDGEIVGSVTYKAGEDDDASFIGSMYVSPAWQRQGLGQRLLIAALADMPRERNVVLYAMKSSHSALCFYEKNGFTPIGETDFEAYGDVHPSLCLIRYAR